MQVGVKFKASPTSSQKQTFAQWAGCSRFIYNAKVEEDRYYRTFRRHALQHTGQPIPNSTDYAHFRSPATPWLAACPSQILRNTIINWRNAVDRYHQGLGGLPTKKRKGNQASITLTRELFSFSEQADGSHQLRIGTKRHLFGTLSFTAHRSYRVPNTIVLSRKNADYFVSFSYEDQPEVVSENDLLTHLQTFTVPQLLANTVGYDRGVIVPVQASSGATYDYTTEQKQHAARIARHIQDLQRQLAKQIRISKAQAKAANRLWTPSKRQLKTKHLIAKLHADLANIRRDFAHQTSHHITSQQVLLHVFEALCVSAMTKAPKPKKDENGKWLPNGRAAKAALNKSILGAMWGMVLQFTTYKAARRGQLVMTVPAPGTSQECAHCGYTHPDNRRTQAEFVCLRCGHIANADENAGTVIQQRGVVLVLSQELKRKAKKKTGSKIRKKKTAPPITNHNTPAGTRGSARGETVRHRTEEASSGAVSLSREASHTDELMKVGSPTEDISVRGNLAGYQLPLFARGT